MSSTELISQVSKYRSALRKILNETGAGHEPIEVVCVVGRPLSDWSEENGREESSKMLSAKNIRVVMYQELVNSAYASYQAFIEKRTDVGRVQRLIQAIEGEDLYAEGST